MPDPPRPSDRSVTIAYYVIVIIAVIALVVLILTDDTDAAEPTGERQIHDPVPAATLTAGHAFRDLIAATPAAGDWRYYATGAAAPWEYRWLLEVACGDVAKAGGALPAAVMDVERVAAEASCWPVLWDHGLIDGDPALCWFACGHALPWEVDHAFDTVLRAWGVEGAEATLGQPETLAPPVVVHPLGVTALTGNPAVDRWLPTVQRHFDPQHWSAALRIIECESQGVPTAKNPRSSASGLFQHIRTYWPGRSAAAGWAGADIFDPEANIAVAAWLWSQTGDFRHWVCKP